MKRLVVSFVALITLIVVVVWSTQNLRLPPLIHTLQPQPTAAPTAVPVQTIINQIRAEAELTTVVYEAVSVVHVEQENDALFSLIPVPPTELTYQAQGEIRAGINLHQITEQDIEVSGDVITVLLPPAQIFNVSLTQNAGGTLDLDKPWLFGELKPGAIEQAQSRAATEMLAQACERGILAEANSNAVQELGRFLSTIAVREIVIVTQPGQGCE